MDKVGLVLEGGGMRGVYTAGVLDWFLDRGLHFPYVIGVSAGACNACSYISRQRERNKRVTIGYIRDPRYLSLRNLIREKSMFGMRFLFDELPNRLEPFDFGVFDESTQRFVVGTTDAITGVARYFEKAPGLAVMPIVQASSSLPFVSQPVVLEGRAHFDGGIADPIPVRKSVADGNSRNVVVLTRNEGYRKKPYKLQWLAKRVYREYPGLVEALVRRSDVYNETLDELAQMEADRRAFIIRPSVPLEVGRMGKNEHKLRQLYDAGYQDAERLGQALDTWLADGLPDAATAAPG